MFVLIGSTESHTDINGAFKGDTHLPEGNFNLGELAGLGVSLYFVASLSGGREWI